jgi:hypothetical protein
MEALIQMVELILRVVLVGALALAPGVAVWLAVAGVICTVRWLRKAAQGTSTLVDKQPLPSYLD